MKGRLTCHSFLCFSEVHKSRVTQVKEGNHWTRNKSLKCVAESGFKCVLRCTGNCASAEVWAELKSFKVYHILSWYPEQQSSADLVLKALVCRLPCSLHSHINILYRCLKVLGWGFFPNKRYLAKLLISLPSLNNIAVIAVARLYVSFL